MPVFHYSYLSQCHLCHSSSVSQSSLSLHFCFLIQICSSVHVLIISVSSVSCISFFSLSVHIPILCLANFRPVLCAHSYFLSSMFSHFFSLFVLCLLVSFFSVLPCLLVSFICFHFLCLSFFVSVSISFFSFSHFHSVLVSV